MSTLLAVDPGIRGTGLALFERGKLYPVKVTCITPVSYDDWQDRAKYVCTVFEEFIVLNKPTEIYLEQPAFFPTREGIFSAKGGDLVKLSMLMGMLYWISISYGAECSTVLPTAWKYRTNKEANHAYTLGKLPALPKRKYTEHELDAIGIGLWAMHESRMT